MKKIIASSKTGRVRVKNFSTDGFERAMTKNTVDSTELALVLVKARALQTDINDLFRTHRDRMSSTELKLVKEAYDGITATLRGLTGLK